MFPAERLLRVYYVLPVRLSEEQSCLSGIRRESETFSCFFF